MFLVALEGLDASGKTTLAEALSSTLVGGRRVVRGGEFQSPMGELLRENLGSLTSLEKVYWFAADRASTLESLSVTDGSVVVWDRYIDSARAYRRAEVELGWADPDILDILEEVNARFPIPDLVLYLSVSESSAFGRRSMTLDLRWPAVRSFYETACAQYPKQWVRIDADSSIDRVIADSRLRMESVMKDKGWING